MNAHVHQSHRITKNVLILLARTWLSLFQFLLISKRLATKMLFPLVSLHSSIKRIVIANTLEVILVECEYLL